MFKLITGALALCGALVPQCSGPAQSHPVQAPIEHIIWDSDQGVVNVSPPDILSVRGTNEAHCADMGGTWVTFRPGHGKYCFDVDY